MREMEAPESEWAHAVSEAARHAQARTDAQAVAERSHGPISRRVLTAAAATVLAVLIGANAWLALQPATRADPMFYARENRAWTIADAADAIDDFRLANGRLPTPDEVADDIGTAVRYRPGADGYVVTVSFEGGSIEYDSSIPLEDWLTSMKGGGRT